MEFYLFEFLMIISIRLFFKHNLRYINGNVYKSINVFLFISFVIIFLTMALRGSTVGSDTSTYMDIYDKIARSSSFSEALDVSTIGSAPLYVGMHFILSRFISYTPISVIVNSAIISIGFFLYIKKESPSYFASVFLFFTLALFFESMNGTRQFMSIAIALNAYVLLKENSKSVRGWILFFVALGIHNTIAAFGLAITAGIFKNIINRADKAFIFSICFFSVIIIGFTAIINAVIYIFPYFKVYLNGENTAQIFSEIGNGRISIIFAFLLFIIISWFILTKNNNSRSVDYVDLMNCLICCLMGMFFSKNVLFIRILWPFMCIYIVCLPQLLSTMPKRTRLLFYEVIGGVLLLYYTLFLIEGKSGIIPYKFFWDML